MFLAFENLKVSFNKRNNRTFAEKFGDKILH
jgi:hypothetical protein